MADELSFTRAAQRLLLDQPLLSRQIRKIEQSLGVALFRRSTRSAALTPAPAQRVRICLAWRTADPPLQPAALLGVVDGPATG